MNIGIQEDIIRGRRTGVGNYTLQMLLALQRLDPKLRFLDPQTMGWKEFAITDEAGSAPAIDRVNRISRLKRTLHDVKAARIAYRLARNVAQRMTYRAPGVSIFHAFNFVPAVQPAAPTLPVVYDLSFIRYPEMHPPIRVRHLGRLPKVIARAPLVHTISEFSKEEIATTFNYPRDRIFVAYPAASDQFYPQGMAARLPPLTRLSLRWKSYLLAVGTLEPRKNLKTLLAAYAELPAAVHAHFPLVIAGGEGWGEQDHLTQQVQQLMQSGAIRFLGFVSDPDLSALYEGAVVMLYPSIYEGFGMPVVEAMACGTFVAHSSGTSMDEIGAGLLMGVPARDVAAWSACMRACIDSAQRDSLPLQSRARTFNWTDSARLARRAYDRILAQEF